MRITLAYNQRRSQDESEAELLAKEDVELLRSTISGLGHDVIPVEVSGRPEEVVDRLIDSKPTLVFNVAEGLDDMAREAFYPAIYEHLSLPYTGGNPALLLVDLDKRLLEKLLGIRGVRIPKGALIREQNIQELESLPYPLFIKPNYEGTSKGITQKSVVHNFEEAEEYARELLDKYPAGLNVEQFIQGREISVPMLEAHPGHLLEIVEHCFENTDGEYAIFDYDLKQDGTGVQVVSPPELSPDERREILLMADRVFQSIHCPDLGRVDIRMDENGVPFFLEVNPIPRLMPGASMIEGAKAKGIDFEQVFELIIRSAARRYKLSLAPKPTPCKGVSCKRPTAREVGITIGRFPTGKHNAITDVENIHVGHVTHIKDDVPVNGSDETTTLRTGITAIVPKTPDFFNSHLVAGGFILNGIGEMSGLAQCLEWGWLETPVLLSNTMSLGPVHTGVVQHMLETHPELGRTVDVVIPVIGETNDAFLNDVRFPANTPEDAVKAITEASDGPVEQGSVGGGTGMISFDFAGGVGTSSRKLPLDLGGYTVGVLVQSNFGKMRNLTIDGTVVGRELDPLYPMEGRRRTNHGSVIVIVATDAPLLSVQLDRLSKRAALGLGRVGSHAAATSGEFVFAFSTGNRASRQAKGSARILNLSFVTDEHINPLYEAVIEATEEAVLNSMFCSSGMTGHHDRFAPPLPADAALEIVRRYELKTD